MSDEQSRYSKPSDEQTNYSKMNDTLFERIKTVQSLPDEVVTQFLNCKGTLRHKKNILTDA